MSDVLPLQFIKGVGARRAEVLAKEGLTTPSDVLLFVPRGYIDRSAVPSIAALQESMRVPDLWVGSADILTRVISEVAFVATVVSVREQTLGRGRKVLKASISDGSGTVASLMFWSYTEYYKRTLKVGDSYVVSGRPDYDSKWNQLTFHHPELEHIDEAQQEEFRSGIILPNYRLTQGMRNAGITIRLLRNIVAEVLERTLPDIVDPLPAYLIKKFSFVEKALAFRLLHFPSSLSDVDAGRKRMKFEELFFFELMLATRHAKRREKRSGPVFAPRSARARALVDQLPFELTAAQRRVIHEIVQDMSGGVPMNRLLQGDVGSGKTIVALLCMLNAVDNGHQALLMAPTEILAEQHVNTIRALAQDHDVKVVQLVGGMTKKQRDAALREIASGDAQIVIGTHALFEATVEYRNLGLIVIDEQHRFGVAQRAELRRLGMNSLDGGVTPHILVMSATPIPRTLSMTLYGDLDVSVIDELPKHRKPIETHIVFESKLDRVLLFVREQVALGRQAYIVYPLVEKSDKVLLKSAIDHHQKFQDEVFPDLKVGLLHGQMKWIEKETIMRAFLKREYDVLVATTVIEVGIDVPNATVMLIENAERFGLAQLHQLRGRVGRGAEQSYCFLATKDHFRYATSSKGSEDERAACVVRLKTMEETTDGFKIAEADLSIRGPGDLLGTRQSGLPEFRFANLVTDGPIIEQARDEAFALIARDPGLKQPEHTRSREALVEIFEGGTTFMTVA